MSQWPISNPPPRIMLCTNLLERGIINIFLFSLLTQVLCIFVVDILDEFANLSREDSFYNYPFVYNLGTCHIVFSFYIRMQRVEESSNSVQELGPMAG